MTKHNQPTEQEAAGRTHRTDWTNVRRLLRMGRLDWLHLAGILSLGMIQAPLSLANGSHERRVAVDPQK